MTTTAIFEDWAIDQLALTDEEVEALKLTSVFDLFISRIESARSRGAANPLQTVTAKLAGGNSRACTKRMLEQLGFAPPERRAVHRLLAGRDRGSSGLRIPCGLSRAGRSSSSRVRGVA